MSLTAIRGKDWAFHALWAACGAYHQKADPHATEIMSNCILDIPFTCIFQNGLPVKALMTDAASGKLKRVYVERIDASGLEVGKTMKGSTFHPLQGMRKCLIDFSAMNAYDVQQQFRDESYIATIIYTDDQVEDVPLRTLDMLLRNETWRLQVMLIQGYIPTTNVQKGLYSRKPQVRSKVDTSVTASADVMSKSVAKYIERAYMMNSQQLLPSKQTVPAGDRGVSLHIDNMQCRFGLDHQNKVIFLYADYTAVEMERNTQQEVETVVRTEKNVREQSAAEKVHRELINLLTQGHQRGLSMESSFEHFDVQREGYIDVDRLIDGLARLGIGVTYPVGELIMQRIGGISSSFFTFADFERHLAGYLGEFDMVTDNKAMESKLAQTQKDDRKNQTVKKENKKLQELMPPQKPQNVVPLNTTWDLAASQEAYPFAQIGNAAGSSSSISAKSLALPEEMYKAAATIGSNTSAQSNARSLPKWASERSKRALRQIQTTELTRSTTNIKSTSGGNNANKRGRDDDSANTSGSIRTSSTSSSLGGGGATRRRDKSNSPPRKTRKDKLAPLDFQTIQLQEAMVHNNPQATFDQSMGGTLSLASVQADELLHIDQGVIMTYRILDGLELQREGVKTRESVDDLRYRSIMSAREREMKKAEEKRVNKEKEQEARHEQMYGHTLNGERSSSPAPIAVDVEGEDDRPAVIQPPDAATLIVIPDISMTLDTLQSHLEVLLHSHPYMRIILVGLIGLPNTIWPKSWVLNSELQAKCIAHMINHLHTTNRLFFDMASLQAFDDGREHLPLQKHLFTMGFGTGGYHLTRCIEHYLPSITEPYSLAEHVRMVILVNGVLKANKKFRLICRDLREALVRANIFEANELITSLHLSDEYLTRQEQLHAQQTGQNGGRDVAFQKFWSSRKLLRANAEHSNAHNKGIDDHSGSGLDYVGILEQLKGIVMPNTTSSNSSTSNGKRGNVTGGANSDDFDGAMILANTPYPVLVVQSTEDVFIDPKTAAVYSPAQLPPERTLVEDLQQLQEPNTVFITWLKAGHEVLQERTPFMLSLLSNVVKMFQIVPEKPRFDLSEGEAKSHAQKDKKKENDDPFDIINDETNTSPSSKKKGKAEKIADLDDEYELMMMKMTADSNNMSQTGFFEEVDQIKQDDHEQPIPIRAWTSSLPDHVDQFDDASTLHSDDASVSPHEKRQNAALEKLRRNQLNIERKKRQMRQSRQSQLEILYLREQEERDRQQEYRETKTMTKEDKRSRFAAEYAMECEVAEISKKIAKEKSKELRKLRREEAVKKVEDELARKRSERIEARRSQASQLVQKIAQEELTLKGMRAGGYNLPVGTHRLAGLNPMDPGSSSVGPIPDGNSSISSAGMTNGFPANIVDNYVEPSSNGANQQVPPSTFMRDGSLTSLAADSGNITSAVPGTFVGPTAAPGSTVLPAMMNNNNVNNESVTGENTSQLTAVPANQRRIDVDGVIEATTRLVQDLFECRQKYLDSIKRSNVLQEKHDLYIKQLLSLENEERRLRRAIRLLEINPSIIGAEMNAESQLQELQLSLRQKQETINEMSSVKKQREQQLYAANRSVQLLKLARKERDLLMEKRLQELYGIEAHFSDRLKDLKMQKEGLTFKRDRMRLDRQQHQTRVDDLTKEMNRIRGHKGKMIDTDVWIPGVMQRCLTKELKKHLKEEYKKAEVLVLNCEREIDILRTSIFDLSEVSAQVKRDQTKMTKSIKIFYRTFHKFQATDADDLAKHMLQLQQKADLLEARRKKELDVDKVFAGMNNANINAVVDKVRLKESEIRTKDERQFVALDLILNPEQYLHLSPVEAEQMSFDEDYQCHLSKTDLERIMKLPEAVNLALPFLHTVEEVNAHRLINMFYRQRDENYFRNLDFICYDRFLDASQAALHNLGEGESVLGGIAGGGSVAGSLMEEISMSILSSGQNQKNLKKQAAKRNAANSKKENSKNAKAASDALAEQSSQATSGGGGFALLRGDMMGRIMAAMREAQDNAEVIHDILIKESLRDRIRHVFDDEQAMSLTIDEKKWMIIDKILCPHVYGLEDGDIEEEMERAKLFSREQKHAKDDDDRVKEARENARDQGIVESLNTSLTRAGNKYNTKKTSVATTAQQSRPHSQQPPNSSMSQSEKNQIPSSSDGDVYQVMRTQYEEQGEDLFGYAWHCPFNRAELEEIYHTPAILLKQRYTSNADYKKQDMLMEVKALLDKYHISEEESMLGNAKMSLLSDMNSQLIGTVKQADKTAKLEQENLRRAHEKELKQQRKVFEASRSFSQAVFSSPEVSVEHDHEVESVEELGNSLVNKGRKVVQQLFGSGSSAVASPAVSAAKTQHKENALTPKEAAAEDDEGDVGTIGMEGAEDMTGFGQGDDAEFELRRIWGSWNQVHPASQGKESQKSFFMRATYNASRDHPAAYAVHDDDENEEDDVSENMGMSDDDDIMSVLSADTTAREKKKHKKAANNELVENSNKEGEEPEVTPRSKGMKTLLSGAGGDPEITSLRVQKKKKIKRARDVYLICESITELASYEPKRVRGRIALLQVKEQLPLFSISDITLSSRQSRSHYFSIPDREHQRILELSVSVVYQGTFTTVGYKLGRLAAGLFRLPEPNPETLPGALLNTSPIPIGFSLHEHIQPNLPLSMGKVLIQHKPRIRPITPGHFQIVIGCASNTKYSIEVTAKYARAALPVIDEEIDRAKAMQVRLPNVLLELDMIAESLRLTERKLLVCDKMMTEAELETQRAHQTMMLLQEKLEQDDEDMALLEDERRELQRELSICEVEYAQWSGLFASRCREKDDVKDGIQMMHNFRRQREEERTRLTEDLESLRQDLPACIRLLRTMTEAIHVAASLNTTYQGVGNEDTSHFYAPGSQPTAGGGVDGGGNKNPNGGNPMQVLTPAAEVRRTMKQFGFQVLSLEQQQWSVLDQHLNPRLYEPWLREQLEHDINEAMSMGKVPKSAMHSIDDYYRANPALEPYILSKNEIEYIIQSNFSMLSRREMTIRKLLTKYHDDSAKVAGNATLTTNAFDPHRAERTRSKHPRTYTKEETEWVSVDRQLHPEIWKYYVNRSDNFLDPRAREAAMETFVSSKPARVKKNKSNKYNSNNTNSNNNPSENKKKNAVDKVVSPTKPAVVSPAVDNQSVVSSLHTPSVASNPGNNTISANTGAPNNEIVPVEGEDFATLIARMQQSTTLKIRQQQTAEQIKANSEVWHCPFDKITILKIWKTPKHLLKTDDERYTQKLLLKYNGTYTAYYSAHGPRVLAILQNQSAAAAAAAMNNNDHQSVASSLTNPTNVHDNTDTTAADVPKYRRIQWEKYGKLVSQDVDERARQVLREIDRAATTRNEYISSDVLHGQDQRFPTQVLRMHLEEELDRILSEQILDRERAERYRVRLNKQQEEGLAAESHSAVDGGSISGRKSGRKDDGTVTSHNNTVLPTKAAMQEANFQRDHVLIQELPNKNLSVMQKVQQRAKERQLRKEILLNAHAPSLQSDVLATRKMLKKRAEKSTEILSDLILSSQLGEGACLACRHKQCQWQTSIDFEACNMRKMALADEMERIRSDRDSTVFQSDVCLSAQLGGNNIFARNDVLDELSSELRDLNMYMEMDAIDKELHDAYNSRKEYFECRALHGFSVLLWTNHARKALNDRQSRLVAMITAKEVVDDILSDMLEGWVFGERQSDFRVQGYVPSLSSNQQANASNNGATNHDKNGSTTNGGYKKGFVRAGHAQLSSVMQVVMKMKQRAEARRNGVLEDAARRGDMLEKAHFEVELQQANPRRARLKIARENNAHEHLLNETEQTLKFGLFMITLMYFRAMTYVKREQSSWAGDNENDELKAANNNSSNNKKDGGSGGGSIRMTDERMKMLHEEAQVAIRRKKMDAILAKAKIGQARRAAREAQERKDAIVKLQSMIRRQRLESVSVTMIQRIYRGHLGRKAAKRWALKRAELGAMYALLNATATAIQRYYRGYRARVFTIIKRMEMAQFIALMRVQESQQDEEVYWQTHPWSRFKRRQKEWMHTKYEKMRGTDGGVLGGSRLTEEEEAKAQGKSLDEIRREIEGLDELDEDATTTNNGEEEEEDNDDFAMSTRRSNRTANHAQSYRSEMAGTQDSNDV